MSSHFPFPQTRYLRAVREWPECGNHILATFTDTNIILYLTCPRELATTVTSRQNFKKDNNHLNVNWILRPSYASAIYASGWGTRVDHEHILALTVSRTGFEEIIQTGIAMVDDTNPTVEFEWELEKDPFGEEEDRSVLNLKIRKETLERFLDDFLLKTDDITSFVRKQRRNLLGWNGLEKLVVPDDRVYRFQEKSLEKGINLDVFEDVLAQLDERIMAEEDAEVKKSQTQEDTPKKEGEEAEKEKTIDLKGEEGEDEVCDNTPEEVLSDYEYADEEDEIRRQIMRYFGGYEQYYDDAPMYRMRR